MDEISWEKTPDTCTNGVFRPQYFRLLTYMFLFRAPCRYTCGSSILYRAAAKDISSFGVISMICLFSLLILVICMPFVC